MSARVLTHALRVVLLLGLLACLPASAEAAPADLDPSFGTGGLVTTDFGGRGDFGLAVALQPDGKIVTAGNSGAVGVFDIDFALSRHNPNGSIDPTFGNGGTVLTDFGGPFAGAFDVAVQPDGKIVAAGNSVGDFAIARYNSNGSLDPAFGSGGKVITDFGSSDQATGLALQSDGKLVVVGLSGGDFAVARYAADGTLDPTFGTGGKVTTDFGSGIDGAFDVAVAANGKIVVDGGVGGFPFSVADFALARYNADGSPDPSFGSGGKVTTDFGLSDRAFALALMPDGRITAVGGTAATPFEGDFAMARYNTDGSLDPSFGSGGKTTTGFPGPNDTAFGVVAHPSGAVTVVGLTGSPGFPFTASFAVARYSSNGSLDTTFGNGGIVTTTFGHPNNVAWDVVAQPDGKVVVAGGTADFAAGITDFALARYLGPPTAITVAVDVKPESSDNVVVLGSNGVIPVAILTTAAFDATTVDPASVCFGAANDPSRRDCTEKHGTGHLEDVNGDARPDLLLHYETQQTGIAPGDTRACLTGRTYAGLAIQGCDRILTK